MAPNLFVDPKKPRTENQQTADHLDREGAWDYKIYIERQKHINSEWENISS